MSGLAARGPAPLILTLLPLYLALFLFGTETFVISPILPSIADDFGSSVRATALAAASYVIVYAALAPFLSYLADTVDRRAALLVGLPIFGLGNVVATYSSDYETFILARVTSGLGAAIAGPAIWAAVVSVAPLEARSRLIGFGMAAFSLGQVAGVPIGGALASHFAWRSVFGAIAAATVLAAVLVLVNARRLKPDTGNKSAPKYDVFSPWRNERASRVLALTAVFHAANLGAYAYVGALFSSKFLLGADGIGLAGLSVGLGSITGSILAGKLGDRARERQEPPEARLPLWCGILAVSLIAFVASPNLPLALVALWLWFVASGAYVTDSQAIVTTSTDTPRALSSAWNTTSMHAGTAAGVFILGLFGGAWMAMFFVAFIFALGAVLTASLMNTARRRDRLLEQ